MAELVSGSRKITELTSVSGISGSTFMPIVMGGSTVRVSHTDFVNSTVFNRTLVSGSAQVIQLLPNGTVSGSDQVIQLLPNGTVSGSSQVIQLLPNGTVSGSSQVSFNGISDKPTLVSSSAQVVNLLPNGTLSGSAQITALGFISSSQTINTSSFATTGSNIFTGAQEITSGGFVTELIAGIINIYATTGNEDTFEVVVQDGNGVRFFDWDGANMQPFLQTDTLSGPITLFRDTTISGSLRVVGNLTANQYIVSSSVSHITTSFSSGSTKFGDTSNDTHQFTGSLSIAGGQFNVLTGSGQLTSSLTFTHNITAPNDGNAILELRHNNDLYNDDIAIKLRADFAGAYIDYEEDGTPYSVLSVQSFANKNVYIHQDTRLLFSNLTVDDNLFVKQNTQLTGSLIASGSVIGLSGFTGSFSGSFVGDGSGLTGLPVAASINTGSFATTASFNTFTSSYTTGSFTGSFVGDGSGLTGVPGTTPINTGSFATTGSNNFIGNQIITGSLTVSGSSTFTNIGPTILSGSVNISGSVNADVFQLGTPSTYIENTAYWLYGSFINAGAISFGFSEGNSIANIDNIYINETSSDLNGAAIVNSLSWISGLVNGDVITIQGIDSSPSNLNQTITVSVNSVTDFEDGTWNIGVSVVSYLPLEGAAAVNGSLYSLTYSTATGDGSQYTITADVSRLLVSSSNTQFSGDVNISGSISVSSITGSLSFNSLTNKPTLVSGSSQISYPDLSNIPNGIISSSAQIDGLFDIDGLVSSSQQVLDYGVFTTTASFNTFTSSYTTGSFTGSFAGDSLIIDNDVKIENGFSILTSVSQSLEFVDDAAAATGGVPLGGLYRSGNFILIRLV
jgi:hypothetical protein